MGSNVRPSPHGEGYVKVYRKLLTSAVFDDPVTLKVWIWCLLRANFQPRPIEFAGEEIELTAGQFITGTFSAAETLKLSKSAVWRRLEKLERWGNITLKSGNRFTIITVNKYGEYQNALSREWESTENPPGNKRETDGNPPGTDKKERRKESKEPENREARPQSLESVENLWKERSYPHIEASKFWNFYSSNGWRVGKNPMKDWKAAAAGWVMRSKEFGGPRQETREEKIKRIAEAIK